MRGTYDGVASIEMFEAVGERYWPAYFRTRARALRARRPRAASRRSPSPTSASSATARSPTSSSSTSSRAACSPRRRASRRGARAPGSRSNARRLRPRLRGDAEALARRVRPRARCRARAGLRRALHPLLALLPRLLRRRLRHGTTDVAQYTFVARLVRRGLRVPLAFAARASAAGLLALAAARRDRRSHSRQTRRRRCPPPSSRWRPTCAAGRRRAARSSGCSVYDGWYWSPGRGWPLDAAVRARPALPPQPRRREDRRAQRRRDREARRRHRRGARALGRGDGAHLPRRAPGRPLTGVAPARATVRYFHNGKPIGEIADPDVRAGVLRHLARPEDVARRFPQQAARRQP